MSGRSNPGFTVGLLATAMVLAVLASPIVRNAVYTHDDLLNFHLPLRAFYASRLAEGKIPTWIPHLYCGFNLHGEGQVGLYHPVHLLLYAALPLPLAFMLEVVLPFVLLLLGTYAFLRSRSLPREASLFGAILFAFAPALLLRFVHMNAVGVMAHLPWLLVAIGLSVEASGRRRILAGVALALLTASQLLLGYPAYVWYSGLAEGLFTLWLAVPSHRWRRLGGLTLLKVVGVLAGAVQLVPTLEQIGGSVRRTPMTFSGDLTSRRELFILSQLFDPYLVWFRVPLPGIVRDRAFFYVHEASFYCGAAVPVLAVWTLLRWRKPEVDGRLVTAAAGLGTLALILAFIRLTPFWDLYRRIPIINLFRLNQRYFVLFALAAATLGAVGLAELGATARRGESTPWRRLWPLALPPLLSTALALGALVASRFSPGVRDALSGWPLFVLGPASSWSAAALVMAAARGRSWAPAVLIALTAADLGFYGLSHIYAPLEPRPGIPVAATIPAIVASLPETPVNPGSRVFDEGATNRLVLKGLRLAGGYVGLTPIQALDYAESESARRVGGVGAVLVEESRGGSVHWERSADPLPRARLVAKAQPSRDPGRDLQQVDPAVVALTSEDLGLPAGEPGRATIVRDDDTQIRIVAEAPTRQLLVLSETMAPGWEARVDGRQGGIVRVYGDFLGCVVPPGRHEVEFRYRSTSLRLGAMVSLSALAVLGAWSVIAILPGRSNKQHAAEIERGT